MSEIEKYQIVSAELAKAIKELHDTIKIVCAPKLIY